MLSYSTEKQVVIKNVWLRLGKLFIQAVVFGYILWNILLARSYQKQDIGFGFTQVKTKGSAYSEDESPNITVWDSDSVVIPEKELDALFLVTNYVKTPQQSRGVCIGTDNSERCKNETDCGTYKETSNGLTTGKCIDGFCELYAWCPLENDVGPFPNTTLRLVGNFTVYLKAFARWQEWGYSKDNVNGEQTPGYNFFTISDFVQSAGYTMENISTAGGAIAVTITWDCNFDKSLDKCQPQIQSFRLDPTTGFSQGFNFRYTNYYRMGDIEEEPQQLRDLFKLYGLRLVFLTFAKGRKFDLVALVLSIGSGIGTMFIADYLSDTILIWFLPRSVFYRNRKYMNVDEQKKEERRQEWRRVLTPEQLNKAYF